MKAYVRARPSRAKPWVGILALLLGSGAAAAQLDAQLDSQLGMQASCPGKHGLRYSVQRLELPANRTEAYPTAINNHGWVVGYSQGPGALPTLWIGGKPSDLGAPSTVSYAYDINDAGRVVGFYLDGSNNTRAVTWYRGKRTALPGLANTGAQTVARGINQGGAIAGESRAAVGTATRAVVWKNGMPRELENLGGGLGSANRINDSGYSVGIANLEDATLHGALWTPKGDLIDLGVQNVPFDINNDGRIVGYHFVGLQFKPLKWVRGVRTVLPTLGGENGIAYAINERDETVGYSQTATGKERATIWYGAKPVQLDTLLDAASSGRVIHAAYAINDKGQIAAVTRLRNGVQPLLLTPRPCHD
jgi:uncharacterized membrane protein